jgi:hypothetical protein
VGVWEGWWQAARAVIAIDESTKLTAKIRGSNTQVLGEVIRA